MNIVKKLLDKIPTSIKKLILLFLAIAISFGLFWYSYRILGLPAMDSGIVPSTIFVFMFGLLYVPLEENDEE